ncbi:M10 family metallopeptidase [Puniceibacterium sp. IMCC21224]|uniref:M10 family metallopeptidase n=1 Tax=Puniceibacterium sp. IMCC21224 TaxID=1618204 RepID=UPI00065D66BC|nr:M10 family metallopeptidase [Puniceibacterium sp. IMCC21224]KMK63977.1 Ca2+-binding protein, RTX toxin [Puniceibacterium sp. IMCC21224]
MCVLCTSLDQVMLRAATDKPLPGLAGSEGSGLVAHAVSKADLSEGADAAGGTNTAYVVAVGETFAGSLNTASDRDWVEISLEAGEEYVFVAFGVDGATLGLDDTLLTLRSSTGGQLATNDDLASSLGNYFSAIEYTASTSGTYYLEVQSFSSTEAGNYHLQTSTDVFSVDQVATYITQIDWGASAPIRLDATSGEQVSYNFSNLTSAGKQLALWALEAWEIATGLEFIATTSLTPDIYFDDNQSGAFAGPNNNDTDTGISTPDFANRLPAASVNVSTAWLSQNGTTIDSYSYQTYLHEIGHALGLGHAGPYDGVAVYGDDNLYRNDSTLLSVMSYFSPEDNPTVAGGDLAILTPMLADLVAVKDLYGVTQAYQGNTVWGANSNVGGWMGTLMGILFDGDSAGSGFYAGADVALTLFDTDGIDTLDLSPVNVAQRIDLRAQSVSNVGGVVGGLSVARGTVIEDVIGGSGADNIIGNSADNRITGGTGNDTINGGTGTDTAVMNVAWASATATQQGTSIEVVSGQGTDSYSNIEFFEFTDGTVSATALLGLAGVPTAGDDDLTGTDGGDIIDGLAGDDTLRGGGGSDHLTGGAGNDLVDGGEGDDIFVEGAGDDTSQGGAGSDTVTLGVTRASVTATALAGGGVRIVSALGTDDYTGVEVFVFADSRVSAEALLNPEGGGGILQQGTSGADTLTGTNGPDTLAGQGGDDVINGLGGDDNLAGSDGNDTVSGGSGRDAIGGGTGSDVIDGGDDNDTIGAGQGDDQATGGAGHDIVNGGAGDDLIRGGDGDDTIGAGFNNDTVFGENGDDSLGGGTGRDYLDGGAGDDAIGAGEGDDTVLGGSGDDFLAGGGRDDVIEGGTGADRINGGAGNDTLSGDAGADLFIFNALVVGERDVVTDFQNGIDTIRLSGVQNAPGSGLGGYVDALEITGTDNGVQLAYGGHVIVLEGVTAAQLDSSDFIFV